MNNQNLTEGKVEVCKQKSVCCRCSVAKNRTNALGRQSTSMNGQNKYILRSVLFFFTNFSERKFLYCPKFFILTENLTPTKVKNTCFMEFYINIFVRFFKSLNISLDAYGLFLSLFKISFFSDDRAWTGKNRLMLLSRRVINKLFGAIANIQMLKFRFKEELKLV